MNDRQLKAYRFPVARADGSAERYWARLSREGRWLSTVVTLNK